MPLIDVDSDKVEALLMRFSRLGHSKRILVFKTDVDDPDKIDSLRPALNKHQCVQRWSIDTEDIDNVLRIQASHQLKEQDIIYLLNANNHSCSPL